MLYPFWAAKAGVGCSTSALAFAADLANRGHEVLVVDLGGDLAAAVGAPSGAHGLTEWLAAPDADADSLRRLELDVSRSLRLLPLGDGRRWPDTRADLLHRLLHHDTRTVVVDVATIGPDVGSDLLALRRRFASDAGSLLVTRSCYLGMRRAQAVALRPTGVVLVREPGRTLTRRLVSEIVGAPVVAEVDHDPAVARAVDAGRLIRRVPRSLARQLRAVVV